jgi:EmrB/QacA subfamily drug resistance transporter
MNTARKSESDASSRRGWTLAAASLALFLVFLDNTVVNVALPSIQRSLTASPDALEWSVNAYIVAFAGLILLGGALGDRLGRKRVFMLGLGLFGAASLAAALASTTGELIAARAAQGSGAALLAPLSLSLLARAFPRQQLASALGVWAGVSGLGLAIGPLVGGLLVDHAGWQAIFWINLPLAGLGLLITALRVEESRDTQARRIDPLGTLLISGGLTALVAGLTHTTLHDWTNTTTLLLVCVGSALIVASVLQQRWASEPLIPPSLLRERGFRAAAAVLGLTTFALFGTLWFLTLYLQNVRGYSAIGAGLRTLPLTLMTLLIAPAAGRYVTRIGARRLALVGLLLATGALLALTRLTPDTGYPGLAVTLAVLGAGIALALPVAATVAIASSDPERVGISAGAATMARQLGGALGLAVLVPLGAHLAASRYPHPAPAAVIGLVKGGEVRAVGHLLGPRAQSDAASAFVHGITHALWLAATVSALALLAAAFLPAATRKRRSAPTGGGSAGSRLPSSRRPELRSRTFAARMGRWSAAHWKTATFGWLAFVAAAFAIGTAVGTTYLDPQSSGPGESGRVDRIVAKQFKQNVVEDVLVQSRTLPASAPAFRTALEDAARTLRRQPLVTGLQAPLAGHYTDQVSNDRHSALIRFQLRETDHHKAQQEIVPVLAGVASVQARHPELRIEEFGDASAGKAIEAIYSKDVTKAGLYSLPLTLVILVVAFGALAAAGIPLLLALSAVLATVGLIALPSHLLPLDHDITAVVLLVGLAVGVDYTMFYLKREREERARGGSERAALAAAAATSGRAVMVSGLTVMVAMAGMFLAGDRTFAGFGLGTMLVVAFAVVGSVTVLPALLSRLGDRVDRGRIPLLGRRPAGRPSRFWGPLLDRVLAHPFLSAAATTLLLLALAAPALQMRTTMPQLETFPKSLPVMRTYARIQAAFPGGAIPATVLIQAKNVRSAPVQQAIAALEKQALATRRMHQPIDTSTNPAGTIELVSIPIDGTGTDARSNTALTTLRSTVIPATIAKVPSIQWYGVSGPTAISRDYSQQMQHAAPLVFAFVLAFAFLLLLVSFRSIVIAIKAILLNLLSVGAAFGVMVLVFQHGWASSLLGLDYTGGIVAFLPIFLFVILFGLSMDYHVLILSRVREAHQAGMKTEDAVAHAIKATAGVVTSAAIVMVGVFSIFGTLSILMLKQFGVGLAAAVLIDATIVRAILLPAAMKLLGDRNWYLPRWLEWLPRVDRAPEAAPALTFVRTTALDSTIRRPTQKPILAGTSQGSSHLKP